MLHLLEPQDYGRVRPLFDGLAAFHVSIGGVFDGWNPGAVYADDSSVPRAAFIFTPEGSYLAGDPHNNAFNRAFPVFVVHELFGVRRWRAMVLLVGDGWEAVLPELLPCAPQTLARRHYEIRALNIAWQDRVPEGFSVHRIDADVISRFRLDQVQDSGDWTHIHGWMLNNWGTIDRFLQDGFGIVTAHGDRVVSWSLADCRSGASCEIGIQTVPEYRRRGLATITAAAAVDCALSNGFEVVGWHCSEDNAGSIGTAENAGFALERKYRQVICYAERIYVETGEDR